jgi:hypothetical protein
MGVFQLSNRGLHPLGQMETGLIVPLIGAREATIMGGTIVSIMTLLTIWQVPAICRFRWDKETMEAEERRAADDNAAAELKRAGARTKV